MQILSQDLPDLSKSLKFTRDQQAYEDDVNDDDLRYMKGYVNVLKERFSRKYFNNNDVITAAEALQRERDQQQSRNRSVSPLTSNYRLRSNENVEPAMAHTVDIARCSYTSEISASEMPKANFVSSVKNIFESKTKVCCSLAVQLAFNGSHRIF
jgi:hypothetical protein